VLSWIFLSGICAGIAALSKPSGLFILPVIILAESILGFKKPLAGSGGKNFAIRDLLVFSGTAFLVCGYWYYKIMLVYGVPWYRPTLDSLETISYWSRMLISRHWYGQFYYFIYLSPLFILFYLESAYALFIKRDSSGTTIFMSWFSVFVLILAMISAKEERYLLPAYPAIAVISGVAMEKLRKRLNLSRIAGIGNIVVTVIFILAAAWSINIGLQQLFNNRGFFDLV